MPMGAAPITPEHRARAAPRSLSLDDRLVMSFSVPRRKVAALAAASAGLAAVLSGAFAPAASAATAPSASGAKASSWFKDPRTPAQRKAEVAVPKNPQKYQGKVVETRAVYRTKAGALAVPMRYAFGNKVAKGQAVTLDGNGLFVINTTVLTASAKAQIRQLAVALENASSVRCEGYADYAGAAKRNNVLARDRADRVCDFLVSVNQGLTATTVSYGPSWPAVVGGDSEARKLNRRVVVEMTGTKPPAPVAPQAKVPGPPVLESVHGYEETAYFAWSKPADDGGSPITGYQVTTGDGWAAVDLQLPRAAKKTLCRGDCGDYLYGYVSGLTTGSTVDLRVRAVNKVGAGAPSNTLSTVLYGAPTVPTDLEVTGDDGVITTTFGLPERTNGSALAAYQISYDGGETWTTTPVNGNGPWTVVEEGFENGATYDVRVRWINTWGTGPEATLDDVLVATVPGAPWIDEPALDGTGASFVLEAPEVDGGLPVTAYRITTDGGQTWKALEPTETSSGLAFALTDLELGHEYDVRVRAVNARGDGAPSKSRTFTPALVPSAPTDLLAVGADGTVTVTFGAPLHDNGAEVTSYDVSFDGGQSWWYGVELTGQAPWTYTMDGFVNGQRYDVVVRANNRVGAGAEAALRDVLVAAVPASPLVHGIEPADGGARVMLGAPDSDGGSTITGYEVSIDGAPWATLEVSPDVVFPHILRATLADLVNGREYAVRVRAVNARGAGAASEPVVLTPSTVPDAPKNVAAEVVGTTVTLTFDQSSDGGSTITGYEVRVDDGTWASATVVDGKITLADQAPGFHTYGVRAVNARGDSPAGTSPQVEVVVVQPGAPTDGLVNGWGQGSGPDGEMYSYGLDWTPGASNGATVTGWQAKVDDGDWVEIQYVSANGGRLNGWVEFLCADACRPELDQYVVIRAVTATGYSDPSAPIAVNEGDPGGNGIPGGDPR